MMVINLLHRKGDFGDNIVCVVEEAEEGVLFGGNVNTVGVFDVEPVVLDVDAVGL